MNSIWPILRSRTFLISFGAIALFQLLCLAFTTPMYDIDTNSFIRGGLSWDIYHNPLLNIYVALCTKIWPNVWFIVGLQTVFFAASAAFVAHVLFPSQPGLRWIAVGLAALEPITMFYNFSILAESFFTSFTLLSVAFLVLWLRNGRWQDALFFGGAMGLTFMAKLSAMIHLPLFGLFLLRAGFTWTQRIRGLAVAVLPFIAGYFFVFLGQKAINKGDLYTVEGRVKWDFSSSMYDSTEVNAPLFSRFVHPYIYSRGEFVSHREKRRELSHLGYKDCVAFQESKGWNENEGINFCDSLFGAVASKIMAKHFWQAERKFVSDNFKFVHSLSYVDYRFTPGLHYYYPKSEYDYIDSLMSVHYNFSLADRAHRIPTVWKSLSFGNVYLPVWWWLWWMGLLFMAYLWLRKSDRWELLVLGALTAIPLVFHLVYISYRARFLGPYLILVGIMLLCVSAEIIKLRVKGSLDGTKQPFRSQAFMGF